MYKMTKRLLLPLLILAFALPSFGQKGPARDGTGPGEGKMHQELNLTDAQEAQMQELRYSHQKEMISLKANLQTAQLELKKLKQADEPNKKKIYTQIEKVGQERVALEKARSDHQLAVRQVLTAEQYKIFRKHMPDRAGPMDHGNRGPRGERGAGRRPFCK